jgi:hypothetical protein
MAVPKNSCRNEKSKIETKIPRPRAIVRIETQQGFAQETQKRRRTESCTLSFDCSSSAARSASVYAVMMKTKKARRQSQRPEATKRER